MTMPACEVVRSLYSFRNAIMLMPCWPSAGPTGGAGVALPAGNCSVMTALTFLDTLTSNDALDLQEVQLDGRFATEERDQHAHLALLGIDVVDHADEVGEWSVDDLDALALGKADLDLGRLLADLLEDLLDFVVLERRRPGGRADEAGHARCVAHDVPGVVVHGHLDHDVPGVHLLLDRPPLAVLDL